MTDDAEVFVDSSYLIALEDADDQNHEAARKHWSKVSVHRDASPALTTTSYVVDEVVTFFNVRGSHQKAVELGETLLDSASIFLIHVGEPLLRDGLDLLRQRPDKRYSLTDCISFFVMRERGIASAFAFDRHFEQEGFRREPHRFAD